jgi:ribonuclease HI
LVGLILRRSDGSVVGVATRIEGEALGLLHVLDWIEKYNYHQIIIEMDNLTVVNAVKNQTRVQKRWGAVVNQCISFLKANPNSTILSG